MKPSAYGEFGAGADGASEQALYHTALRRLLEEVCDRYKEDLGKKVYYLIRDAARELPKSIQRHCDGYEAYVEGGLQERRSILRDMLRDWPAPAVHAPSAMQRRIEFLADRHKLADFEAQLLGLVARREAFCRWQHLFGKLERCEEVFTANAYAILLNLGLDDVFVALSHRGRLIGSGMAESCGGDWGANLQLYTFVKRFFASTAKTEAEMAAALAPVLPPPTLDGESFAHMAADLDRASRLIGHALKTGERTNVLLYGVPGTGKTELARLLAQMCGCSAISIGEADEDGDEPSRDERLSHLRLCRKLMGRLGGNLLVIDEAEDLFLCGIEDRGSKLWLNKLVEDSVGPHVWIINEAWILGEPVLRRMDLAIRFDLPSARVRRGMVERIVARSEGCSGLEPTQHQSLVAGLVGLGTSPAISTSAVRTGTRLGEEVKGIVGIARDLAEAAGRLDRSASNASATLFDPALSLASTNLVVLADRLSGSSGSWSLLLSGPPGTGKSAYARHLAERSGQDLICKSGADLLGMYVGQTEKAIASAFAQAERQNAILLIDEADSCLANREGAERNWEVSMTNEMLRQMERVAVRFVATTNRAASLDPACARRFTMQVEFETLDAERARRLFVATFGQSPPKELDRISGLTPGDFAQVLHRADLLGEIDASNLVSWLAKAVAARDGLSAKIGF